MAHAVIDTVAVDFTCGPGALLRANGATVVEKGFTVLYTEGKDDQKQGRNGEAAEGKTASHAGRRRGEVAEDPA